MTDVDREKLLGLLGLARRAGQLAVGATAVEVLVRGGRRPWLIVARDAGASTRARLARLAPVRGVVDDAVDGAELARALGRAALTVVAVGDPGFVRGIERLLGGAAGRGERGRGAGADAGKAGARRRSRNRSRTAGGGDPS